MDQTGPQFPQDIVLFLKWLDLKLFLYARLKHYNALVYLVHKLHYVRKFSYVPDMHFSFI